MGLRCYINDYTVFIIMCRRSYVYEIYIATTLYTYLFMYVCSLDVYEKPWVDDKDGRLSDYII